MARILIHISRLFALDVCCTLAQGEKKIQVTFRKKVDWLSF